MERNIGVTEAREKFAEIVERVQYQGAAVIISRHGKPAVAVVPMQVYENWKRQRQELFAMIRATQEENKDRNPDEAMQDIVEAQQAIRSSSK